MGTKEKLVELLLEYDQMRMMRMSIEECADRLIPKGLTVRKYENDTKCSDFAICLDENKKEKTNADRIRPMSDMEKCCGNCDNGKWINSTDPIPEICLQCAYVLGGPSNWKGKRHD